MTPERKYDLLMREKRSRQRWSRAAFFTAVLLSLIMIVASEGDLISVLAMGVLWGGVYGIRYIANHGTTIVLYFRIIHTFMHEQDALRTGAPLPAKLPTSNLSASDQDTFEDLVNRLRNS